MDSLKINWENDHSEVVLNPRLSDQEKSELQKLEEKFRLTGHIWLTSSGSSKKQNESFKLIALSKKAFLASAKSVNDFFGLKKGDHWVQVLPHFHVGGLSILTRAYLSGSKVNNGLKNGQWDPEHFINVIETTQSVVSSLVPTQLFDLVKFKIQAPKHFKFLIVGGATLNLELHKKASKLGWPIVLTYGMTETCSQIAATEITTTHNSFNHLYRILNHAKVRLNSENIISIKADSLMTGYAQIINQDFEWINPIENGWYQTHDLGELKFDRLTLLGRIDDYIKVNGEGVNLNKIRELLNDQTGEIAITAIPHSRSGNEIVLFYSRKIHDGVALELQKFVNNKVLPFERINSVKQVEFIPKLAIGKINYLELRNK